MSYIHLSLTNLSSIRALHKNSIWNKNACEHIMALCFLCDGNGTLVCDILRRYKENQKLHLFNEVVRHFFSSKILYGNINQQNNITSRYSNQDEEDRKSMSLYLLLHLFVNIVNHLNLLRKICGLDQQRNQSMLQAEKDLRMIEFGFNYFFPIFQHTKFGKSHRIDSSEFLNYFLNQICSDMDKQYYINFGYDIEYINTCENCHTRTVRSGNSQKSTFHNILNLPLLPFSDERQEVTVNEMIKDLFKENIITDYSCEKCAKKDLILKQQSKIIRFPNVMIFSLQRKIVDSEEVDRCPVRINKQLCIGNEDYQLRSIIYHEGSDENVHGHYTCHCLVECKTPRTTKGKGNRCGQWFYFDDDEAHPITPEAAIDEDMVKQGCVLLFYEKTKRTIVEKHNYKIDWRKSKKDRYNILPPTMLHIGDNCFANVIFQSLAFLDFEYETNHYMKATETWNRTKQHDCHQTAIPIQLKYDSDLISTFPTKIFKDFEPNAELKLEKALIRYNDADFKNNNGDKLFRSLLNHPCNLFIDTRYLSCYGTAQKTNFYLDHLDLFSRLLLEYPMLQDENMKYGYFTTKKTDGYEEHAVNTIALNDALDNCGKVFEKAKFIEYLVESWGYLYVMPTALYLNEFPFVYKKKDFLNRKKSL